MSTFCLQLSHSLHNFYDEKSANMPRSISLVFQQTIKLVCDWFCKENMKSKHKQFSITEVTEIFHFQDCGKKAFDIKDI